MPRAPQSVSNRRVVWLLAVLLAGAAGGGAETLPIRPYTINEGLAHNHVSHIYRDSHDFLWFCTDEGLSRFDGRSFVNYTVASGLAHMHVNDIIESRTGEYWIATDGGVTLFRPDDVKPIAATYSPDGPPEALFTNVVMEEPDGAALLGTAAGLYRLRRFGSEARIERVPFPAPPDVYEAAFVNTILLDSSNGLWIGTASGLYWRTPAGQWTRFTTDHGLPHNFVECLITDPEGRKWACTRHGLVRLSADAQPGKRIADLILSDVDGLPHRDVRAIAFGSDGRRWIATLGGLVEWRPAEQGARRFRVYTEENGLTDRAVYAIAEDPEANLWLGTRRGGVMRLSRSGFQTFGPADGLEFSGDDGLVETRSGHICVTALADPRRPLRCYDGQRFQTIYPRLPDDFPGGSLHQSAIQDHIGDWWVSGAGGLLRFSMSVPPFAFLGAPGDLLLANMESRKLFEDSSGDLWITTHQNGVFGLMRWERPSGRMHDYAGQLPHMARKQTPSALAEAPKGQIWMGLARPGGLVRRRDGHFQEVPAAPGGVNALYQDRKGRLWIAFMEAGLGRIDHPEADHPSLTLYSRSHGLSSNEVWSLAEDRAGNVYAGTAAGVDRLNPATGRIDHYSVSDGLTPGDIRAALSDRNGDLWFLSNRGLSRLRPDPPRQQRAPVTRITDIRVAGSPHPVSELGEVNAGPFKFPAHQNSIQVDYAAIEYRMLERLQYQYRLEGASADWSLPTSDGTVHFANLAPGEYRFLVRALSSHGGDAAPASLAFVILPPIWQRWWFLALAAVLGGLGIYALYRYRVAQLMEVERVRTRIATDLHDDLGSNLSLIAMVSEVAGRQARPEDQQMRNWLSLIADTSREMMDSMSDLVWAVNPDRDRLDDMTRRMRRLADEIFGARNIELRFDAPETAHDLKLGTATRREVFVIFKEAVNNIARHALCTRVEIEFRVEGNWLSMTLSDNGRGFDAAQTTDGNGLAGMRRRSKSIGGTLEIKSQPGQGTQVILRAPVTGK